MDAFIPKETKSAEKCFVSEFPIHLVGFYCLRIMHGVELNIFRKLNMVVFCVRDHFISGNFLGHQESDHSS